MEKDGEGAVCVGRADGEPVAASAVVRLEIGGRPRDLAAGVPRSGDDEHAVRGGLVDRVHEHRRRRVAAAEAEVDDPDAELVELREPECDVGIGEASRRTCVNADHVRRSAEAGHPEAVAGGRSDQRRDRGAVAVVVVAGARG